MYPSIYGGDSPNTAGGISGNRSRYLLKIKEKESMDNESRKLEILNFKERVIDYKTFITEMQVLRNKLDEPKFSEG